MLFGLLLCLAACEGNRTPPLVPVAPVAYADQVLVTATPRGPADVEWLWEHAEHVLEPHAPELITHRVLLGRAALQLLRARGVPVRVEPIDVERWIERLDDAPAAGGEGIDVVRLAQLADPQVPWGSFFGKVQELAAIESYLSDLAASSQGRATVMTIGKSIQGREVKAVRITGPGGGPERPAVVIVGAQHAREWASPMVAMGLVDRLVRLYEVDPRVRRVVDQLQIYVNPVNNPDGYVATFGTRRLQRKNLNPDCGVDLNRNYPTAWGMGVGSCNSETFPGRAALSEPESQAVANLINGLARPVLFIDYHSTAAQVMIPFAYTTTPPPNLERNRQLCELYSSTLKGVRGTDYPARPGFRLARGAGGGVFDWFRDEKGEAMVVELGGRGFALPNAEVTPFAEENFRAWMAVAEQLLNQAPAPAPEAAADAGAPPEPPPVSSMPDASALETPSPSSPPGDPAAPPTVPQPQPIVDAPESPKVIGFACTVGDIGTAAEPSALWLLATVLLVLARRRPRR